MKAIVLILIALGCGYISWLANEVLKGDRLYNVSNIYRFELYRFEYQGQILENFDDSIYIQLSEITETILKVRFVNITSTMEFENLIETIYIGMEAWRSNFPQITVESAVNVVWLFGTEGPYAINVTRGEPIDVNITITYPACPTRFTLNEYWINSLVTYGDSSSIILHHPKQVNQYH